MSSMNSFLKEFLDARKNMDKSHDSASASKRATMGATTKLKPLDSNHIDYIIKNKPGRKEIKEYLEKRVAELSAEKMK